MTGSTPHHRQEDTIRIKEKHHYIVSLNMPVDENTSSLEWLTSCLVSIITENYYLYKWHHLSSGLVILTAIT